MGTASNWWYCIAEKNWHINIMTHVIKGNFGASLFSSTHMTYSAKETCVIFMKLAHGDRTAVCSGALRHTQGGIKQPDDSSYLLSQCCTIGNKTTEADTGHKHENVNDLNTLTGTFLFLTRAEILQEWLIIYSFEFTKVHAINEGQIVCEIFLSL